MLKHYILDIETTPQANLTEVFSENITAPKNLKDPEKIKQALADKQSEAKKLMSIDTDYADIACIGLKEVDGEAKLITLTEFAEVLGSNSRFITFNGKKFDIPIIIKQGLKNGIKLDYRELRDMTDRYKGHRHTDLMEVIGDYGQYKSLDKYLQIYLGIKKTPIDFDTCTIEELQAHCLEDLANTEALYKLFKPLI